MAQEHFEGRGEGAHKAPYSYLAALVVMLICALGSWLAWFSGWWVSLPVLPTVSWFLAIAAHDGSHFTVSKKWRVNHLAGFLALPFVWNPYTWYSQHVVQHHCHTNDINHDADLFHFTPFRLHWQDEKKGSPLHLLKVLLAGLDLALIVPFIALTGFWFFEENPAVHIKFLGVFRRSAWHKLGMFLSMCSFGAVVIMSVLAHDTVLKRISFVVVPYAIDSLIFIVFTQVSHLQEACQREEVVSQADFFRAQAESSMDYNTDSQLWCFLSGGLNVQSLHHCLPWVHPSHYTAMYPKFRDVCRKHGVRLNTARHLPAAVKTWLVFVVSLNLRGGHALNRDHTPLVTDGKAPSKTL